MGSFLRVLVARERTEKAERITENWYGTHLSQEGLKTMVNSLYGKSESPEPEEIPVEEINNNWRKAAGIMKG